MNKNEARRVFLKCAALLTLRADAEGLPFLLTCAHRSAEEQFRLLTERKTKVKHSQHQDWLAWDIVLLDDAGHAEWGHQIGDAYERLGVFWEELHPLCRWGGRFGRDDESGKAGWDPYHFEISRHWKTYEEVVEV